jgi:hypothetical protein
MLTERDNTTEIVPPNHNEMSAEQAPEKPRRKRSYTRRRLREEKPEPNQVKVNANFSLPIEQFAQLANDQFEEDDEEEIEEVEETDSRDRRHLLYGPGLASLPFQPRVAAEDHSESVREHLRQVNEASAFKARIWSVPAAFAQRNPMIQRKPKVAPGWAMRGEIQYDPDSLESDLLALFADGYYFVEIRERGQFHSGQMVTVGDPSSPEVTMPQTVQRTIVHEPAAAPDPLKDAKANAFVMNSVIEAATKLLEAQAHQQPAQQKQPSLKDRLEELKMMQQMFAPAQPQQQQRDPLERPAEQLSSFWDFAAQAAEYLAPGLNPLLAGVGQWLLASLQPTPPPQQPPPMQRPVSNKPPQLPQRTPVTTAPATVVEQPSDAGEEPATEDDGVNIQFLVSDLLANEAPQVTADKVKAMLRSKPFIRPFLNEYLSKPNAELFGLLIGLCEGEQEAVTMREGLQACTWKEDWLNSLKRHLRNESRTNAATAHKE